MEVVLDPAALAGLAGLLALSGWALGRAQAVRGAADTAACAAPGTAACGDGGAERSKAEADESEPVRESLAERRLDAPSPCQQRASEERRAIFANPVALAELHDQVRSIRRNERIFDRALAETGLPVMLARGNPTACRYLGRSGEPTCPGAVNGRCHQGEPCAVPGLKPPAGGRAGVAVPPQSINRAARVSP